VETQRKVYSAPTPGQAEQPEASTQHSDPEAQHTPPSPVTPRREDEQEKPVARFMSGRAWYSRYPQEG
jgi:hypothetical protein